MTDVADHADHAHPDGIVRVELDPLADRILAGPGRARELLVDQDDRRRPARVRRAHVTSRLDRNPHGGEVAGRHDLEPGVRRVVRVGDRHAFEVVARTEVVAADRQRDRGSHGADAGHLGQALLQRLVELHLRRLEPGPLPGQVDFKSEEVVRVEPDVDVGQPHEAPHEQDRSDEQDHGDGNLDRDERVAGAPGVA
jgi:hypothetical protein